MDKNNWKAWLYLLPALIFLGIFMVYPLFDVLVYSVEEGYNSASQTFSASEDIIIPMCSGILIFFRH